MIVSRTYSPTRTSAALAKNYGLQYVGYYLTGAAALTFAGLLAARETKDEEL